MSVLVHSELIYVKSVRGKGRGVFARKAIKKGNIIERVPVLIFPVNSMKDGHRNRHIGRYHYEWCDESTVAISLGYGSLYNHSFAPNAKYKHGKQTLTYVAVRDIKKGEEITINYNFFVDDRSAMKFDVK